MDFSRRRFVGNAAKAAGTFLVSPSIYAMTEKNVFEFSDAKMAIMQGLTNRDSAQVIVLIEAEKTYEYRIVDDRGETHRPQITRRETREFSKWGIEKLLIEDLSLEREYTLQVFEGSTGEVLDERTFAPLDTLSPRVTFAVGSCMNDRIFFQDSMWKALAKANPQMVFLIGDTCYSDNGNSDEDAPGYWRRYVETRRRLAFFRQKRLIPTLATWDDHDYGGNNFDSTFHLKSTMQENFDIFWGNERRPEIIRGPGVSQIFSAFGQRFFLMDDRSFRSPNQEFGSSAVHWGEKQEEFLFSQLASSSQPAWLMNGSQFFGGYLKKDAFEYRHIENLRRVCRELSKIEAPVAFASGDVHFSEYMSIEPEILGYPTFEITSSSIHSHTFFANHLRKKNPRRIDATSAHNFVIVEAENDSKAGWSTRATCQGSHDRQYMDHQFLVRR